MIHLFYGSDIDSVIWRVYREFDDRKIKFLDKDFSIENLYNLLFQPSLLDEDFHYVFDITNLKIKDKMVNETIKEIIDSVNNVTFVFTKAKFDQDEWNFKSLKCSKIYQISENDKKEAIDQLFKKYAIKINDDAKILFTQSIPSNYDVLIKEVEKLSLLNDGDFITKQQVAKVVYSYNEDTIFEIINYWTKGDFNSMIKLINSLVLDSNTALELTPAITYQLFNTKLFLKAHKLGWNQSKINSVCKITFWQQKNYSNLLMYNDIDKKINRLLHDLYSLDIDSKLSKKVTYNQLIAILLKE